jgi:hypothetical protein
MQLGEEVIATRVYEIIIDIVTHNKQYDMSQAVLRLDRIIRTKHEQCKLVIVLDTDRTLTARDTGLIF